MEGRHLDLMKKIDPHLRSVLKDFSKSYLLKRESAFAGLDFETLRSELAEVKDKALSRWEEHNALFESKAREGGAKVYRAADSAEANRLVYEILKTHGAGFLVKSKSMVSEETGLNEFLSRRGIEARETDLGEWTPRLHNTACPDCPRQHRENFADDKRCPPSPQGPAPKRHRTNHHELRLFYRAVTAQKPPCYPARQPPLGNPG